MQSFIRAFFRGLGYGTGRSLGGEFGKYLVREPSVLLWFIIAVLLLMVYYK